MSRPHRDGSARAQLVTEFLRIRRLKLATLGVVVLAIVAAIPVSSRLEALTRDPAFVALDELPLPTWAALRPRDAATGSRWCLQRCRVAERVWHSSRDTPTTVGAYRAALRTEHWRRFDTEDCPTSTEPGDHRCFRRDAFALDLWIRPVGCRADDDRCTGSTVLAVLRPLTRSG